jgi:hypothetical protein
MAAPMFHRCRQAGALTPPGARETGLLQARAVTDGQRQRIGDETGGWAGLFPATDDFDGDYDRMRDAGVRFTQSAEA